MLREHNAICGGGPLVPAKRRRQVKGSIDNDQW
jgi:hypothetical protein